MTGREAEEGGRGDMTESGRRQGGQTDPACGEAERDMAETGESRQELTTDTPGPAAFELACARQVQTDQTSSEDKEERRKNYDRAMQFAMKAHQGQVRKGSSVPYIVHPVETALIAMTLTHDQDVIIAALFHDIIEDTPYGAEEIEQAFGARVAKLVQAESENKRKGQNASDTWKIRKQEFIDSLEHKTQEEKIIAISDKLSNMRATYQGYREHGVGFWQRFNEKRRELHAWYYRSVTERLREFEDTDVWKELDHLVREVFKDVL